ncbi:hypothetical protein [Streptomyces luteogriseus]|uniref:hypothetical protein n=1 Tax=Streptomyces luteogriseus TaxID=68233 RepID=UPI0037F4799C
MLPDVVVMENALVRERSAHPAVTGDAVLVGPHAPVNGATREDEVFVTTAAGAPRARLFAPGEHDELRQIQEALDFPGTV